MERKFWTPFMKGVVFASILSAACRFVIDIVWSPGC